MRSIPLSQFLEVLHIVEDLKLEKRRVQAALHAILDALDANLPTRELRRLSRAAVKEINDEISKHRHPVRSIHRPGELGSAAVRQLEDHLPARQRGQDLDQRRRT